MIKLKSLLKEQAEFKTITTALQTAVKTFNNSAATVLANEKDKSYVSLAVDVKASTTQQGNWPSAIYTWNIISSRESTYNVFTLTVYRIGSEKQYTNIGYSKKLIINVPDYSGTANNAKSGNMTSSTKTLYFYNAHIANPTVSDYSTYITNFKNAYTVLSNEAPSEDAAKYRNTAKVWQNSGAKLIEDLKSVFNSIEIAPATPEGKKTWKGMKKV